MRILNSQRPQDASGTLITRDRPAGRAPLTAVASKKGVTVVDITSTRMLMAHGFLRAHLRGVRAAPDAGGRRDDVGGQRVGDRSTIARRLPEIIAALSEVADVTREDDMAILCAVGDGLQNDPAFVGQLLEALERRADPDGVAGRGAPEHHARDSRGRSRAGAAAACTSGSSERCRA